MFAKFSELVRSRGLSLPQLVGNPNAHITAVAEKIAEDGSLRELRRVATGPLGR